MLFYTLSLVVLLNFSGIFAQESKHSDKIVFGKVVNIEEFPYQIGLVHERFGRKRIICGGALVGKSVVFTAAHCTHSSKEGGQERDNLEVLVGANYLGDPKGVLHQIRRVHKHPLYGVPDFDHDFSVLILEEPVQFTDRAQKIPISTKDHLSGGETAMASGWGLTEQGRPSKFLRATELEVEQWNQCQRYFPGVFHPRISENMICVKPDRKTTYFGDSGGPLVVDGELIGLVSFGRRIGKGMKTTVFTRVKNFLHFVEDIAPEFFDY